MFEEEEKKGPNLLQIAATAGIGYLGFRNRNKIFSSINKLKTKASVTLAKGAGNQTFKGVISDARNLNRAMDDLIEYSPAGLLRSMKRPGLTEEIMERTAKYNVNRDLIKGRFPLDEVVNKSAKLNRNHAYQARRDTRLEMARDLLSPDSRVGKAFGNDREAALDIYRYNVDKISELTQASKRSGKFSHEWTELIQKHEFDPKQNIKLSFDDVDKRTDFAKKIMETANEIENNLKRESVEYATSQLRKLPTPEGNRYGRHMELYDMSSYQALRQASSPTPNKAMENVMHQVSMDEARRLKVVQENGRLYGIDADLLGNSAQDHLSVQNAFNTSGRQQHPNTNLVSSKVETNFADQYIEKGQSFGLDTKALGQDIFASNLYINEATGELLNLDAPKDLYNDFLKFADNYQVPLIGISPSRFMPGRSRVPDGDDFYHIFQGAKDVQPLVEGLKQLDNAAELRNAGARSNPLAQSYLFMNDKIVDTEIAKSISGSSQAERFKSFTEQLNEYSLKGDFLLTDARVGLGANLAEVHSGRTNREDLDGRNVLQRLFALGGQERDSNFTTAKNALSKFKDPLYGGNAVDTLTAIDPRDIGTFKEGVSRMQDNITGQTRNFDVRTQNTLYDTFNQLFENDTFSGGRQFDFNQLTNEEELVDFVEAISLRKTGPGGRDASSLKQGVVQNLEEKASYLYHRAKNNPDFLTRKRLLDDKRIFQSQMSFMFEDYADEAMTGADDLRRFVEQYAVATADHRGVDILSPIRQEAGINHRKVENHIANYRSLNELSYFDSMARSVDQREGLTAISAFQNHYVKGTTQRNSLEAVLKETDPWYGTGSHVRQEKLLGQTRYVAIEQGTSPLEAINERLVQAASNAQSGSVGLREQAEAVTQGIYDWSKETFAGKADNVSTNSLMPWFFANRLDTTLQQWGLGLPNEMKTSAIATVANQWARRIVLPYVGFKQLQYFDGLTGDVVSDTAADTYVNAHVGIAGMKELTGINHVGREMERIFPWLNQIEENPFVKGFNFATMGAFSEFRSPEELEEYYVSGEDAVRKGRYWGIGSSSPYIGGRIEYFQPNWYRRAKSDYMFSENVYGSEKEYWANSAIPTLTNPLAPVKHFLTDPYHYEEKHADSRPYVLTGGFSELESIPLIGPVVNRVAQTVLKPEKMNPRFKSAHQDYLTQQNEQLIAAYAGMNAGGHAMISPTSFKMQSTKYDINLTDDESGLLSEEKLVLGSEDFNQTSSRYLASVLENMPLAHIEGTSTRGTLAPVSVSDILTGDTAQITSGNYSQMDLAAINQNLIDGRSVNRNDNVKKAGTLLSPNIIRDEGDWANSNALFSTQGVFRDVRYNFSEMAGMYGFLTNTATGFDERARVPVLESSERFSSYADAFWDKNLGGLGGDASEIFRRYVPREKSTHYNPIRNDQPGWMPGMNYFIDFQHGDPYCVSPSTLIETAESKVKEAKDIEQGDLIKTHKGNWMPVKRIATRKIRQDEKVYEIKTATNAAYPMQVSEGHPILVLKNNSYRNGKKAKPSTYSKDLLLWKEARELEIGDYVAYPIEKIDEKNNKINFSDYYLSNFILSEGILHYEPRVTEERIKCLEYILKNGIPSFYWGERKKFLNNKKWSASMFNAVVSSVKQNRWKTYSVKNEITITKDIAYLFGLWVAEGSASLDGQIKLVSHINESNHRQIINTALKSLIGKEFNERISTSTDQCIESIICHKPLAHLLIGLFGTGAKEKSIPQVIKELPNELLAEFIKGYFSGDGSMFVHKKRIRVSLKTTSINLAYQIKSILLSKGIVGAISTSTPSESSIINNVKVISGTAYSLNFNGLQALEFIGFTKFKKNKVDNYNTSTNTSYLLDENYLYVRINDIKEVNHVKEVIGFEVDIDDSFCVAGVATHNSKIANAEMRLPGDSYDKLYGTRRDQYGNYSALDRYRILADVAPYSDEFRLARKEVALLNQNGILSESQQAEYRQIREQVSAKMQKKQFYDKRFENADTERRQVTVDRVIDVNTFLTKEFPNNPFKFAGITVKADDEQNKELVSSMIKAGQRLTVELDKNPQTRIRSDMMDTMRAVVYAPETESGSLFGFQGLSKGQNMNLFLSKQEGVSVKDDGSATATKALFDTTQQRVGGLVDTVVHDVLPTIPVVNLFADKFLKVQTPLRAYEDEIYSKSWRPWENPITGWVKPMFDRTAARNPIASSLHGFGIGALSWRNNRWKAGAIGALVFGGISGARSLLDVGSSVFGEDYDVWKPERREKEFEINEYFDRLTYVKYKGLYNRAAELAKKHEGFDLDEMYRMQEEDDTAGLETYLQNQKKWLTINKKASGRNPDFYDDQLENVKFQMNQLDDQGTEIQVGTYTALAIRYRDAYESTLYAAGSGETYDYNKIYQALPSKDKPYFTAFQKAGIKDRQRILELVPDNQRPIYQRFFGDKIQRPESNEDYFDDYNLPGNNWDGWQPDVSLDNVKLKVMQQEGIELTEANFWPDDAATADAVGARPVEMGNSFFSRNLNQGELTKILEGAGLKDVKIGITSSKSDMPMLTSELNITQHRNLEIEAGMRDFLAYG